MSGYDVIKGRDPNGIFVFVAVDENGYLKVLEQGVPSPIPIQGWDGSQYVDVSTLPDGMLKSGSYGYYNDPFGPYFVPINVDNNGNLYVKVLGTVTLGQSQEQIGAISTLCKQGFNSPTLDTNAYTDGDVLFEYHTNIGTNYSGSQLISISLYDIDGNAGAFDMYFFGDYEDYQVSMGALNDAAVLDPADAYLFLGKVSIEVADYDIIGSTAIASISGLHMVLEGASGSGVTVIGVSRDTKTYTATGISFRLGLIL